MGRKVAAVLGLMFLLGACAPSPTEIPAPAPVPQLGTTPEMQALVLDWMEAFQANAPAQVFDLIPIAPGDVQNALEQGNVQLVITAADVPAGFFATPLLEDSIAVIVHDDNPLADVSLETLQALFSGRLRSWEEINGYSEPVQLLIPIVGDPVRLRFDQFVMEGQPFSTEAVLAATPRSCLSQVQDREGAVGFLPLLQVSSEVKILQVESVDPTYGSAEYGGYPLMLQIVAIAEREPQGVLLDFLLWIQAEQD